MLYTLVYRYFTLCSDWTKFHREVLTLKEMFQRNGYPKSFIDKCFKKFLDRLHITKPALETVEKKSLRVGFIYLGPISSSVRTKIRNAVNRILNFCKLQIIFKNERKPSTCTLRFSVRCGLEIHVR